MKQQLYTTKRNTIVHLQFIHECSNTRVMGLSERRVRQNPYSVYHNFTDEKTLVA